MTGRNLVPGGRLPAGAALGMAILWTGCALGFGFLAFGASGGGVLQVVAAAAGVFLAGCYWFRYAQARRKRG